MKFHEISQTGLVSRSCQTRKSFDLLPVVASMPERPQEVKNSEHSVSGFGIGWQSLQPWFRGSDGDADGMQGGLIWTPPTKRTWCYGLIGNVNILYIHVCGEHVANRGRQKKMSSRVLWKGCQVPVLEHEVDPLPVKRLPSFDHCTQIVVQKPCLQWIYNWKYSI